MEIFLSASKFFASALGSVALADSYDRFIESVYTESLKAECKQHKNRGILQSHICCHVFDLNHKAFTLALFTRLEEHNACDNNLPWILQCLRSLKHG